jgi:glycosyltransferase involved in cell wall biosynthesis
MRTLRVGLDARTVYSPTRRGTGKNLIDLYRRVAVLQPDWTFVMFHRERTPAEDPFASLSNVEHHAIEIRGDRWNLWEQVRLPAAALASGVSLLHAPANTAPAEALVPLVVTIHDLIPLDIVENPAWTDRWERNVGRGARQARRIITPSAYTRRRIVDHFGVPEARVVVNHWAPDTTAVRVTDESAFERVRARHGVPAGQPYVFGFGAIDPRKNTRRMLQAWAGLPAGLRASHSLLLVGLVEPALTDMRRMARDLMPEGGWSLMPFAEEADIPVLMSGALALCYPSLSEGFGLPVLDAFSCATPVITSRTTSLPEVAGDAAILVDPSDTDDITRALARMIDDAALRQTLRQRGTARLTEFSWDRCAKTAAQVLADAA